MTALGQSGAIILKHRWKVNDDNVNETSIFSSLNYSRKETVALKDTLFIFIQYLVPQHLISRITGWFGSTKIHWIKSLFIEQFVKAYNVNMDEAENSDPASYACFNDFFCRALKADARPMAMGERTIVSPADGAFSQLGKIKHGRVFQAKGQSFSTEELLGGHAEWADKFDDGEFATIYLSPKDYHRLHMPIDGTLISMRHVPGELFSVNPATTSAVPRLFARNERLVCMFDTPAGPMAMVLVGAMIVASIETVWSGLVAPAGKEVSTTNYHNLSPIELAKGAEMGRFKLGSTVVLLFPKDTLAWQEAIGPGHAIRLGEAIAEQNI